VGLSEEGIYHHGTRHLSSLLLRLEGERPLLLGATARADNTRLAVDLTNPDMRLGGTPIGHGTLHIARTKVLWEGVCYERVTVRSFDLVARSVELTISFAADFADIFEVRGMRRIRRGTAHQPVVDDGSVMLAYDGLDGVTRRTRIGFEPSPVHLDDASATFRLDLDPGRAATIQVSVACDQEGRTRMLGFDRAVASAADERAAATRRATTFASSSQLCDDWLQRSMADIVMMTTHTEHGPYPYAGVPWFSTVFGRDALIVARQLLWIDPELARGVLAFLAAHQADHDDPSSDAQAGKILHEMRHGEMAATGEVPFARYYGSHDATPLFVALAAAHFRQTGDVDFATDMWPHVERALAWMESAGDPDGDGFLEYERRTASGLLHQGWKDSHDSTFHADGALADGPIALSEIQGYAFAARMGAARLADALGHRARAVALRDSAERLRQAFDRAFWLDELGTYAMALDGDKRPTRIRTSNPGHCLASGIALPERAERVAEGLMSEASFSGWGVRTVAAGEARYNPMSYHDGSIWPHDTALAALGLGRYGYRDAAARVTEGLFDASRHFDLMRLPELFCGFSRRDGEAPTQYPVACSPQSWAAGAPFMLLEACLGLRIDAGDHSLSLCDARLPRFIDSLRLDNLPVGRSRVDLELTRAAGSSVAVNVTDVRGEIGVDVRS
jgi:glycogen debranching enzyme